MPARSVCLLPVLQRPITGQKTCQTPALTMCITCSGALDVTGEKIF